MNIEIVRKTWVLMIVCTFAGTNLWASTYSGEYYSYSEDDGLVTLIVDQKADGRVSGTMSYDGYPAAITGRVQGEELAGVLNEGDGESYGFRGFLQNGKLMLLLDDGEYLTLSRGKPDPDLVTRARANQETWNQEQQAWNDTDWPASDWPEQTGGAVREHYPDQPQRSGQTYPGQQNFPHNTQTWGQTTRSSSMSINGRELSADQVQLLAQYRIQAQPGSYWYDPHSGAWGVWGMPTAGFVMAGIAMPPLPAHASNGNSGIIINGRNIPMSEAMYLQQLAGTSIQRGYYWLDAQGNAGPVGGRARINFLERARQAQGGAFDWTTPGAGGGEDGNGSGGVWIQNPIGGTGTTATY